MESNCPAEDKNLDMKWPSEENPEIFGKPFIKVNKKVRDKNESVKYYIPIAWWEPILHWLRQVEWSKHGLGPFSETDVKAGFRSTWTELTLLFQIQSGYKLDRSNLDLASQERASKIAVS